MMSSKLPFAWLLLVTISAEVVAQDPHLAYVYPAGCQVDSVCEMKLGGQHLKEVNEAYVSGQGVKVEIVDWYRPMTRGEYNGLRNRINDTRDLLIEKGKKPTQEEVILAAGITREQEREMEIYRERERDPKRQPNDQLAEELTLRVVVEAGAELGKRELRLISETAMSNPLWIKIDQWEEVSESEPNDISPNSIIDHMPMVVNGQIMPGDVDRFSFQARRGERLVIEVGARDVIPYLADAVPGWFQASLSLRDDTGQEVSYAESFYYRQDPVIYFVVPEDGRYTIQLHDSLYRGREDFVYRITLGELPFVTSTFPLGARCGEKLNVELQGWNLSETNVEVQLPSCKKLRPVHWTTVTQSRTQSVRFPLLVDLRANEQEQEPNDNAKSAQEIKARVNINGRIDTPGDEDVFLISGAGRLVAEVHARRQGSPLDSVLTLTDLDGKEIAFSDDHVDKSQGLSTHHADSLLEANVPSAGAYLHLTDSQNNGGKDFVYRLSLRSPQPEYEVRVAPGSIVARAGSITPLTAYALRKDKFDEDIELALLDPPPGFKITGGLIPGNEDHVSLTLHVPDEAPEEPVILEMATRARRGYGNRAWLTHIAIPSENMMQAFIWHHLVPVDQWTVVVSGKPRQKLPFTLAITPPIDLRRGRESLLLLRPLSKDFKPDELKITLNEPKGVTAEIVTGRGGQVAIKLTTDADLVPAGLRGNLLIRASKETKVKPTESNPNPRPRIIDYGYLPAIPFKVSSR